jgi:hypothetical protein
VAFGCLHGIASQEADQDYMQWSSRNKLCSDITCHRDGTYNCFASLCESWVARVTFCTNFSALATTVTLAVSGVSFNLIDACGRLSNFLSYFNGCCVVLCLYIDMVMRLCRALAGRLSKLEKCMIC